MELKTDDMKLISREEYRAHMKKVMDMQTTCAAISCAKNLKHADKEMTEKVLEELGDILHFQLDALKAMEYTIFGNPPKKDEDNVDGNN